MRTNGGKPPTATAGGGGMYGEYIEGGAGAMPGGAKPIAGAPGAYARRVVGPIGGGGEKEMSEVTTWGVCGP